MVDLQPDGNPRIAVAIPCLDEAAAVGAIVDEWRRVLPGAEVVVFDNDSTDGTGAIARSRGARVVDVPTRGKGHAVRAIFAELAGCDAVIMADGDGTYPATEAPGLLGPVLAGAADMVVGARRPAAGAGAMSSVRGVGNVLIRLAFRALIGRPPGDLLSGYRVFGRAFLGRVRPRSTGFEIEAELTAEAVAAGLRVVELDVSYHPRAAGTVSKLRALRDGRRIVLMIASQSIRLRPLRFGVVVSAAILIATAAAVGIWRSAAGR